MVPSISAIEYCEVKHAVIKNAEILHNVVGINIPGLLAFIIFWVIGVMMYALNVPELIIIIFMYICGTILDRVFHFPWG